MIRLRERLAQSRWERRVAEACRRAALVERLVAECPGLSLQRAAVAKVAPGLHWSTARNWWKRHHTQSGAAWERQIDLRLPPAPWSAPEAWRIAVQVAGRQVPTPTCDEIRAVLAAQFGKEARLGNGTIRSILKEVGLAPGSLRPSGEEDERVELPGGGGLVLLLAAAQETGAIGKLSGAVRRLAEMQQAPGEPMAEEPAGRDEQGRLTGEYNRNVAATRRAESPEGTVFRSVAEARVGRDLTQMRVSVLSKETLAQHLSCLVALPLVSQRRGTKGLDDPSGAWLRVLSEVPYLSSTLTKTLTGLKFLDASPAMWEAHARTWTTWSGRWSKEAWRQLVCYVDSSKDPWWTSRFARSGKVSRTGRVQPCLDRVVLTAGPGVPILAEVLSGTEDLAKRLPLLLQRCDDVLGKGAVGRITVVDNECCEIPVLRSFAACSERDIVTVLKGQLALGKVLEHQGPWIPYRERDQIREVEVQIGGDKSGRLRLRGVEMQRPDSRQPKPVTFLTTASKDLLGTTEVPDAYLSRWPSQEDVYRRGRDGVGLDRTQGFGVSRIHNVALVPKKDAAARRLCRAEEARGEATDREAKAVLNLDAAKERLRQRRAAEPADQLNRRHALGVRQATRRVKQRRTELRSATQRLEKAKQESQKLETTPTEIYARDTALDSITTCLKMVLLCLLEFICQEYLDGKRIMPSTFTGAWLSLPVTIRTSRHQVIYEIAPNPRDPAMTDLLRNALDKITERRLRVGKRRLIVMLRQEANGP